MESNSLFLKTLNTPSIDERMNSKLVHPVSLVTALKWLANIRDAVEHNNKYRIDTDEKPPQDEDSDMSIVKEYQRFGIPDLPIDPVTGEVKTLNLFVVGCGNRAYGYLRSLFLDYKSGTAPYRLVGVADPIPSARERLIKVARQADHSNYIAEYDDWRSVQNMGGDQIDIALIMTLDRDHAKPAVYFMSKGCHVVVEKPLGVKSSEMDAMVEAMYKYNRIAAVCTVLEYTPHARKMKELLPQLGSIESLLIREQVGWCHDAYAYGTGPFSSAKETSPYSIAKTIHDMSMGLNLTDDSIESMIYMPSNSKASRGKYSDLEVGNDIDQIELYEPHSYLRPYTHKLIYNMRGLHMKEEIDQIIEAVCEKKDGEYVLPIPAYEDVENHRLTEDEIRRIADLYKPFHMYLYITNFWYNPMLYRREECDQPSGFTIVSNMSNGCQFQMICRPLSSKVCVRHYQIGCTGGEIVSDCPEITCTKFGDGGKNTILSESECEVPDISNISKRMTHEGADAMFSHTVFRIMGEAIIKVREFEAVQDTDGLTKYVRSHPLNIHFERNARLTSAILRATEQPNTLIRNEF